MNAGAVFGRMMANGQLSEEMTQRMKKGSRMPGWTKRADFDWYETISDRES